MGMLSIDENKNLLNPHEWKKEYKPILNTDIDKQIYGPDIIHLLRMKMVMI